MTDLEKLSKRQIALRYWLQGRGFFRALAAMDFAQAYHQGTRKDGVTPEFSHQIAIGSHVRTFESLLRFPEEAIMVAFLHDVREDYDVADAEIRTLFGDIVADATNAMTKEFRGTRYDPAQVFAAIGADPIASVVKLCDRIHNHASMLGVFRPEKMQDYTNETEEYFLPMLKKARRTFSDQEPVYEALSLVLRTQMDWVGAVVQLSTK